MSARAFARIVLVEGARRDIHCRTIKAPAVRESRSFTPVTTLMPSRVAPEFRLVVRVKIRTPGPHRARLDARRAPPRSPMFEPSSCNCSQRPAHVGANLSVATFANAR